MNYTEIKKDLFTIDYSYALAQCISEDAKMGAGIAAEFSRRYRKMRDYILQQNPNIGDAIAYQTNEWLIFNLITKSKYWHKPTPNSFKASIVSLKKEILKNGVQKLAIPLLGAGLDRLSWAENRKVIQDIFSDTDVEIIVCKDPKK